MSTHNLCFGTKIKKIVYPCKPQFQYIKVVFVGVHIRYLFRGHVFLLHSSQHISSSRYENISKVISMPLLIQEFLFLEI